MCLQDTLGTQTEGERKGGAHLKAVRRGFLEGAAG